MTNEQFTEAQQKRIRSMMGWVSAHVKEDGYADIDVAMKMLTPPAIGPDVPVMDSVGSIGFMRQFSGHGSYTPMLPVPEAREIARRACEGLVQRGDCVTDAMVEVDRDLAAYTRGEKDD